MTKVLKGIGIVVLFCVLAFFAGRAFAEPPPVSIKGQGGTKLIPKWNLQTPPNQTTNLGGIDALIETGSDNLLANPGFEAATVTSGWTVAGSVTAAASTTFKLRWIKAIHLTPSNVNGEIIRQNVDMTSAAWTQVGGAINMEAYAFVYLPTFVGPFQICIGYFNGGTFNESQCADVAEEEKFNKWVKTPSVFMPWTDFDPAVRIKSTSATSAEIYIDDVYLGPAKSLGFYDQLGLVASGYIAGTAGCIWTTTSTTFVTPAAVSACPGPTVEFNPGPGTLQTTDTDLPQFTINNLPDGMYEVEMIVHIDNNAGGATISARLTDGTTPSPTFSNGSQPATGVGSPFTVKGVWNYTASGNRTWTLQVAAGANQNNVRGTSPLSFWVKRVGGPGQNTVGADQTDFDWTTCPSISSTWVSNTTTTCKWRRRGSMADFDILSTTSGAPTSANLVYTLPITIDVSKMTGATGSSTPLEGDASTATDAGVNTFPLRAYYASPTTVAMFAINHSAGTYSFSSNVNQAVPHTFGAADFVSAKFSVPVAGWRENGKAPQLINSVVSPSNGVERIVRANITNSGTPTVSSQSGSWVSSITDNGTGDFTVNVTAGTWSGTPSCNCTQSNSSGANAGLSCAIATLSTSAVRVHTHKAGVGAVDEGVSLICMGPR